MRKYILTLIGLLCVSCAPVQGYEGPALPREQVALIYSITQAGLERDSLTVDGRDVSYFSTGVTVLPGVRDLEMAFREKPDSTGEYAGCYSCFAKWVCHGSHEVKAGKEYKLKAVAGAVWVFEGDSETPRGSLSCREIGSWW